MMFSSTLHCRSNQRLPQVSDTQYAGPEALWGAEKFLWQPPPKKKDGKVQLVKF
jgi:hypothetical protein